MEDKILSEEELEDITLPEEDPDEWYENERDNNLSVPPYETKTNL